jgi:hypothetical protein
MTNQSMLRHGERRMVTLLDEGDDSPAYGLLKENRPLSSIRLKIGRNTGSSIGR